MKRRLVTICVCLLLGAIVNVAVAWGLFSLVCPPKWMHPHWVEEERVLTAGETARVLQRGFAETQLTECDYATAYGYTHGRVGWRMFSITVSNKEETGLFDAKCTDAGWPLFALTGGRWTLIDESVTGRQTWLIPLSNRILDFLPATPMWPGFAINTVFYAAVLWLLFAGTGRLRRFIRLCRGLCPACAYPIGESELCTECGKPVTPKA